MRFNGYFAFHFYNEPMLYQEDITKVINMKKVRNIYFGRMGHI